MNTVDNFGWRKFEEEPSLSYLFEPILQVLKERHCHTVLDLGCGNGVMTKKLSDNDVQIVGCDADREGIRLAKESGVECFEHNIYDKPERLGAKRFDAVVSAEVIEHLFFPKKLIDTAYYCLKSDGVLILTTPYHGYFKNFILSLLDKWDSHLDPLWDGGHIKLWSKRTLKKLLLSKGFTVVEYRGVGRLPFLWKSIVVVAIKK